MDARVYRMLADARSAIAPGAAIVSTQAGTRASHVVSDTALINKRVAPPSMPDAPAHTHLTLAIPGMGSAYGSGL